MGRKYQRNNGDEPLTDVKVKAFVIVKQSSGLSFRKSAQRGISKSSLHSMSKTCDLTGPQFLYIEKKCPLSSSIQSVARN